MKKHAIFTKDTDKFVLVLSTLPEDFQPPGGEPIWPAEFYGETYPYP